MSDLMEATGLEKGGIYRHFPSKEAVAAEAFDYAWERALEKRREGLDDTPHAVDKLRKFIANFVEHPGPVAGGCPLLNSAIDSDDGESPVMRKRVERALDHWREYLASTIQNGMKKGEIKREVNPSDLATLMIASLEGALMISRLTRDREAMRPVADHLSKFLETVRAAKRS
jgi:TetR/AcrR family transcriptional regulator, transcriptional repressor for nem operon